MKRIKMFIKEHTYFLICIFLFLCSLVMVIVSLNLLKNKDATFNVLLNIGIGILTATSLATISELINILSSYLRNKKRRKAIVFEIYREIFNIIQTLYLALNDSVDETIKMDFLRLNDCDNINNAILEFNIKHNVSEKKILINLFEEKISAYKNIKSADKSYLKTIFDIICKSLTIIDNKIHNFYEKKDLYLAAEWFDETKYNEVANLFVSYTIFTNQKNGIESKTNAMISMINAYIEIASEYDFKTKFTLSNITLTTVINNTTFLK